MLLNPLLGGLVPQRVPHRLWEPVAVIETVVPSGPVYQLVRFGVTIDAGYEWRLPKDWEPRREFPPARPPCFGVFF